MDRPLFDQLHNLDSILSRVFKEKNIVNMLTNYITFISIPIRNDYILKREVAANFIKYIRKHRQSKKYWTYSKPDYTYRHKLIGDRVHIINHTTKKEIIITDEFNLTYEELDFIADMFVRFTICSKCFEFDT